MNYVKIEPDQCKGCRVCISVCPKNCLVIGSRFNSLGYQSTVFEGEDRCTACGFCFYACPEPGVITVFKDITDEEKAAVDKELAPYTIKRRGA